jgi:hypothetical protein
MRSCQLCNYSRISQHFNEPGGSLIAILGHAKPFHTSPSYLTPILIFSTYLHHDFPGGLIPSGLPTNILNAFLFSLISAMCPAHLLPFDLMILIYLAKSISYEDLYYAVFSIRQDPSWQLQTSISKYKLHSVWVQEVRWDRGCFEPARVYT